MRILSAVFLFILSAAINVDAQQVSYHEFQKEADTNSRLRPKFGGVSKTADENKADTIFIANVMKEFDTSKKASDYLVRIGFDLLAKGDPKTAIYRFNQAWLVDPSNENSFWGFGGIYFYFKDFGKALEQYTEGLVINPKSANILVDMATIGMARFNESKDENDLASSLSLLKRAYEIDSANQLMLAKLSICYFLKNDCENARKYYDECKKLGGKTLSPSYTAALDTKCKN